MRIIQPKSLQIEDYGNFGLNVFEIWGELLSVLSTESYALNSHKFSTK